MSTAIAKNFQVGSDSTATNNFTIRQPATPDGTVRIANGNSGTTTDLVTVTSAGNVGVGTTSPGARLHVAGEQLIQPTTAANAKLSMRHGSIGNNNYFEVDSSSNTIFGTNNTERARITSGGDLLVGTTSSTSNVRLRVDGGAIHGNAPTSISTGTYQLADNGSSPNTLRVYNNTDSNNTTNRFLICDAGASVLRAEIRSNGGLANYSANNVNLSDRREKTNLAPAKSYLDTICAIPVQTFNYIDQSEDDPGLTLGVVAQDVQAVAPELVMESNWGTEDNPKMRLSIYQTDLQYALMKCIQELKAELDSVKTELALLKGTA